MPDKEFKSLFFKMINDFKDDSKTADRRNQLKAWTGK
jgi:hypothetical protein